MLAADKGFSDIQQKEDTLFADDETSYLTKWASFTEEAFEAYTENLLNS